MSDLHGGLSDFLGGAVFVVVGCGGGVVSVSVDAADEFVLESVMGELGVEHVPDKSIDRA